MKVVINSQKSSFVEFFSFSDQEHANFYVKTADIFWCIVIFRFRAFSSFSGFFGFLVGLDKFSSFSGFGLGTLFTSGRAFRASGSSPKQHYMKPSLRLK